MVISYIEISFSMKWFCRFALVGFRIISCLNKAVGFVGSLNEKFCSTSSGKLLNAVRQLKKIVLINTFFSPIVVGGRRSWNALALLFLFIVMFSIDIPSGLHWIGNPTISASSQFSSLPAKPLERLFRQGLLSSNCSCTSKHLLAPCYLLTIAYFCVNIKYDFISRIQYEYSPTPLPPEKRVVSRKN